MKRTRKFIKNHFSVVLALPYCSAQYLFRDLFRAYYTSGIYGWNADVYTVDWVAVVIGYRPFGTPVPTDIIKEYEEKAKSICENCDLTFEEQNKCINELRYQFVLKAREVLNI